MVRIKKLVPAKFPSLLREIPDPPETLYLRGELPDEETFKFLAVVGSRKVSQYGKQVCEQLISDLSGFPVCIISGLALGVDGLAHKAALRANLPTIAIPGSGLSDTSLYPASHRGLAENILKAGGALLSEFEPDFKATPWGFPRRNRIMAGLSHAVLVIEASARSGTLITSRLATEYNRDVLAVPGSIFSPQSKGPHMLLRLGATPITSSKDILEHLGFDTTQEKKVDFKDLSINEQKVIIILQQEQQSRDILVEKLDLSVTDVNILLTNLELKGVVKEKLGKYSLI